MRCKNYRSAGGLAAFALAITVPILAAAQQTVPAVATTPADTPPPAPDQKVTALLKLIADTIAAMPPGSKSQDIEGRLSFAIDQAQPDCSASRTALASAAGNPALGAAAKSALRNIGSALSRCQNIGTAALAAARTVVAQGTSLSVSGGTSNYVRP